MVLERVYDGCAVVKLPELEAILAASVLPGGRLLSRRKAAAANTDYVLALQWTMCSQRVHCCGAGAHEVKSTHVQSEPASFQPEKASRDWQFRINRLGRLQAPETQVLPSERTRFAWQGTHT